MDHISGRPGKIKGYISSDRYLGFAPRMNVKVASREYYDNHLLYDVIYTINKDGLRVTPLCNANRCNQAILFFGCSLTFGEGLNDNESMPYLVGEHTKYKVFNFGFHGYGPHQMLSAIDHGLVEKKVDCIPKFAIYQGISWHISRAAGKSIWDQHGPKYVLTQDEKIKFAGNFDGHLYQRIINKILNKSCIYQNFFTDRVFVNSNDVKRYIAIVVASQRALLKNYPGLEFHVIYWDDGSAKDKLIVEQLQSKGIKVHLISDILPDYNKRRSIYQISIYDVHPNFKANKYIAQYIIRNIIHDSDQSADPKVLQITSGTNRS